MSIESNFPGAVANALTNDAACQTAIRAAAGGGQPAAAGALILSAATQSLPDNTSTAINFDTVTKDTNGFANLGVHAERVVIPSSFDGWYYASAYTQLNNGAATGRYVYYLELNGTQTFAVGYPSIAFSEGSIAGLFFLAAGDIIKFIVGCFGVGGATVTFANKSHLGLVRVGT